MKANKIRVILWKQTNSTFMDFQCKGMDLEETEKMEYKFNGMRLLGSGSHAEVRGTKEYVFKKNFALNYSLDEFNNEIRTMLAFHDQPEIVEFYNPEDDHQYKTIQCFYPKNLNRFYAYLVLPKYFATLHSYITVKKSYIIQLVSWKFDMMIKMTIGIKKLHDNGFIHCDLKPENIFMIDQFNPIIGDLGEALSLHEEKDHKSGTNEYLAPEIAEATNKFNYTNKVDIFALGVLFVDIIAGGLSVDNFVPNQEKFKKENIENYYTLNEQSKKLYEHFEPLILQMTSDVPSFRPDADQIIQDLLKRLKQYLDEDQTSSKSHMKAYDDYIKLMKTLYDSDRGPNQYHNERKKEIFYYMKRLVTHEVEYFKSGKLNLDDRFFRLQRVIPSEALNIKNPAVQFIKREDLTGSSLDAILKRPQKRPIQQRNNNSALQQNQNQPLRQYKVIATAQPKSELGKFQNQSAVLSNQITNTTPTQVFDQNRRNSLQDIKQTNQATTQPERIKFTLSNTNNNMGLAFREKFLKQQILKKQQAEENKKKEEEQQKLEQEKKTLLENQLNIVNSIQNDLQLQMVEQQHKMIQNQDKFVTEKQELFSQAKIVINMVIQEREYLQSLKGVKPEQVKNLIGEVHERVNQAQKQADEIQNKFYEIEKKIEQENHVEEVNSNTAVQNNEDEKYSLFGNDAFDFKDEQFSSVMKGRASMIHNLKKEFNDDTRRYSIPSKLDHKNAPNTKEQAIELLKQKFEKVINQETEKSRNTNDLLVSQPKEQKVENDQLETKEQKITNDEQETKVEQNVQVNKKQKNRNSLGLKENFKSVQDQIQNFFENHIQNMKEKPLTKQQILDLIQPKHGKTFHEKKSRKHKDFYRSVTESQSLQQRKMKKNKGNQWKRILI